MRIDKHRLALHFGMRAGSYDNATPLQHDMALDLVEGARARLGAHLPTRILELGCGTGRMTARLTAAFPGARILALDIAPEMIERARGAAPGAEFLVADAESYLMSTSGQHDLIISNAVAQWFEDTPGTLARARARLAPGGLLALATFAQRTFRELDDAFERAYANLGQAPGRHVVALPAIDAWRGWLPGAECIERDVVRDFPDVRAFLRSVQQAGAVNALEGPHVLAKSVWREMSREYAARHATAAGDGIVATYHVALFFLRADENRGGA